MAATEPTVRSGRLGRIVAAACALPGVIAAPLVHAEEAPDKTTIAFKLSGYNEWQSNANHSNSGASGSSVSTGTADASSSASANVARAKVISPSLSLRTPLGREWALEGSGTVDHVSGASPAYYADQGSFSPFKDTRRAVDGKLTRYFHRQSLTLGGASSTESDYRSRSLSLEGRWATDDQNTTFNLGGGWTRDRVNPSNEAVVNARKSVNEFQLGVTQAVNRDDLVQLGYTHIAEQGYLSDPYKLWDSRPDQRRAHVLQLRWNHWLGDTALKLGYRWYRDDWGIRSHTVDVALPLSVGGDATFTPEARWYTQSTASFYVPVYSPVSTTVAPQSVDGSGYTSLDQRLSAFGAITVGGKLAWPLADGWAADVKLDYYRQDRRLRLLGNGSWGMPPLSALIWQVGVQHSF